MDAWEEAKWLNESQVAGTARLMEMATTGRMKNYIIIVWMNDNGNIPHFHVVDSSTLGDQFSTCIQIEKPEYFHHTGKEGVLNSKERKALVKFLRSPDPDGVFETNWDVLLYEWNKNNSRRKISRDIKMPNCPELK